MDLMVGVQANLGNKPMFPMIKKPEIKVRRIKTNKYKQKGKNLNK